MIFVIVVVVVVRTVVVVSVVGDDVVVVDVAMLFEVCLCVTESLIVYCV